MANNKDQIFGFDTYDLGDAHGAISRDEVDHIWRTQYLGVSNVLQCIGTCANEPVYYIMPKYEPKDVQESIKCPICAHCVQSYSRDHYVLKHIDPRRSK